MPGIHIGNVQLLVIGKLRKKEPSWLSEKAAFDFVLFLSRMLGSITLDCFGFVCGGYDGSGDR